MEAGAGFPVESSLLSAAALAELALTRYGLPVPVRSRLISRGLNDVYRIEADGAVAYLRVTGHGWRSEAEVAAKSPRSATCRVGACALRLQ